MLLGALCPKSECSRPCILLASKYALCGPAIGKRFPLANTPPPTRSTERLGFAYAPQAHTARIYLARLCCAYAASRQYHTPGFAQSRQGPCGIRRTRRRQHFGCAQNNRLRIFPIIFLCSLAVQINPFDGCMLENPPEIIGDDAANRTVRRSLDFARRDHIPKRKMVSQNQTFSLRNRLWKRLVKKA